MKIHTFLSKEQIENRSYETNIHSEIVDSIVHSKNIQNRCKTNERAR